MILVKLYNSQKVYFLGVDEKQTKKFRNLKASTKLDKNGGEGIADFIVGFILEMYFIIIGMFKYKSS